MNYPYYRQLDSKDCGPTCLRMVSKFYGKEYSLQYLRELCYTERVGSSLLGISDGAEKIGFRTIGARLTWAQLMSEVKYPCIIHWRKNHFVVVYEITNDEKVIIGDPAHGGILKYNKDQFLKCWLATKDEQQQLFGIALLIEPNPNFYKNSDVRNSKLNFRHLFEYLKPHKTYIIQILFSLLLGSGISLIFPFLTQSIVDIGIGSSDVSFVFIILIAQVMLTVGEMATDLIRSWLMLHVTTRVSISLIADFLSKLMRLPISFFDTRLTGDIIQRIDDFSRIQSFLTGSLISIFMALIGFIIYGCIMAGYNIKILIIFIALSILYILWVILFMKHRRKLDYMRFQESSASQSNIIQLITGMQEVKLNNCEKQKRWEWEHIQAKLYKISIKSLQLKQIQQIGGVFINQTKNVIISFIAAKSVIDGNMSLGMMMALQYIIGQMNAPVIEFINFMREKQDARLSLERLDQIHTKEDEEPNNVIKIKEIPVGVDLELKDVTFHYNGIRSPRVLDNINLKIEANKITAIVGISGSGKTTILKLLLGFYEPTEGSILLGNIPIKEYSDNQWRRNCGVVMQDGFIFSDSVANNIGIIDDKPDLKRIYIAAKIANIDDYIRSLPIGIDTQIGTDGK
jgi:ATP-binding cassette subfamily B protein